MTFARLRIVKGFFDGAQETDRNIGRLHPRYPVLSGVLRKDFGEDGTQFVLVGDARAAITKLAAKEIGASEYINDKAAKQAIIGAGDIKRRIGTVIQADGRRAIRRIALTAWIHAAHQISHAVELRHGQ